jgi:DNA-binding response OmpR family regulator
MASRTTLPLILVVDDQDMLRRMGVQALEGEYRTLEAKNGQEALRLIYQHKPALILLDLNMPVMDGWEALRRIRDMSDAPVILVTARDDDTDVVRGLDAGAQDYITKPYRPAQLKARVRSTLRDHKRTAGQQDDQPSSFSFDDGRLVLDGSRRLAIVRGEEVDLSATEYRILEALARHAGQVLSNDQILEHAWGPEYAGEDGYVKTYVGLLRKKIEQDTQKPAYLKSRRGFGYYLDPKATR